MSRPDDAAHAIFVDFIAGELNAERQRKNLLHRRGLELTAISGVVATLLVALGATGAARHPRWEFVPLCGTVALFTAATIVGIIATRATPSAVADIATLERLRREHWTASASAACEAVAHAHTLTIAALRAGNNTKTRLLDIGQVILAIAVVSTVPTVIVWTWPR